MDRKHEWMFSLSLRSVKFLMLSTCSNSSWQVFKRGCRFESGVSRPWSAWRNQNGGDGSNKPCKRRKWNVSFAWLLTETMQMDACSFRTGGKARVRLARLHLLLVSHFSDGPDIGSCVLRGGQGEGEQLAKAKSVTPPYMSPPDHVPAGLSDLM